MRGIKVLFTSWKYFPVCLVLGYFGWFLVLFCLYPRSSMGQLSSMTLGLYSKWTLLWYAAWYLVIVPGYNRYKYRRDSDSKDQKVLLLTTHGD